MTGSSAQRSSSASLDTLDHLIAVERLKKARNVFLTLSDAGTTASDYTTTLQRLSHVLEELKTVFPKLPTAYKAYCSKLIGDGLRKLGRHDDAIAAYKSSCILASCPLIKDGVDKSFHEGLVIQCIYCLGKSLLCRAMADRTNMQVLTEAVVAFAKALKLCGRNVGEECHFDMSVGNGNNCDNDCDRADTTPSDTTATTADKKSDQPSSSSMKRTSESNIMNSGIGELIRENCSVMLAVCLTERYRRRPTAPADLFVAEQLFFESIGGMMLRPHVHVGIADSMRLCSDMVSHLEAEAARIICTYGLEV
jgi:hypothetical protein